MNKTSSPAEQCAREIFGPWDGKVVDGVNVSFASDAYEGAAAIIQRLVDSELSRVHQEYQKLAEKLLTRKSDRIALRSRMSQEAAYRECASELLAIAPKEKV